MRHVGHLPRIIIWCTFNKMHNRLYLKSKQVNRLWTIIQAVGPVVWGATNRNCGEAITEIKEHLAHVWEYDYLPNEPVMETVWQYICLPAQRKIICAFVKYTSREKAVWKCRSWNTTNEPLLLVNHALSHAVQCSLYEQSSQIIKSSRSSYDFRSSNDSCQFILVTDRPLPHLPEGFTPAHCE